MQIITIKLKHHLMLPTGKFIVSLDCFTERTFIQIKLQRDPVLCEI